ncbi:unnamed protein product [Cunninghamella echinulata]
MCQPIQNGGLNVLSPSTQSMYLQFRWLHLLLDSIKHPSFIRPLLLQHFQQISPHIQPPFQALIFKDSRKGPLCSPGHFAPTLFTAFDSMVPSFDFTKISIATCLSFPLHFLLDKYPKDYWFTQGHHKWLVAPSFFYHDPNTNCLRILTPKERTHHRSLFKRLYRNIFNKLVDIKRFCFKFNRRTTNSFWCM